MTANEHGGRSIEAEITAHTDPLRAWEAWADPGKLAGWFVDRAVGEGRSGETMTWIFERFGLELPYAVLESVPGERIVFGPASKDVPPFLLEITLTRAGGDTRIRLVNSGFGASADFDEQFAGIDSGWRMALAILKEYLERHFGMPKATFLALRPAVFEFATLAPWFTEAGRLGQWLGSGSGVGDVGDGVSLTLFDGATLTGEVLCRTPTEVALRWTEIGGTCELKAFSQGAQRVLCIRGFGWGMAPADARALEARMADALGRLAVALEAAGAPVA